MSTEQRTASERLAESVVSRAYDDVVPEAREYIKTLILDILGNAVAGASTEIGQGLLDVTRSWGTDPHCQVWGVPERLPAPSAVLVNAHRAHCMEFDPFHEGAVVHPVTIVLPCVLATAERMRAQGRMITGAQVLSAVAIGVDTAVAVGLGAEETLTFFRPATAGAFGGVAGIAALAGWSSERTAQGFGLVLGLLSGTMQAHEEGSSAMALIVGMNGRAAMSAADLLDVDLHPPREAFEGRFGYYSIIEGAGSLGEGAAWVGTGEGVLGTSIKPFPTGRATHGAIHALEQIDAIRPVRADDVARVRVTVPPLIHSLVGRPVRPGMAVNYARLSLPYLVARYLLDGRIDIQSFTTELLSDPRLLAEEAKLTIDIEDTGDPNAFTPHAVEVEFRDGTTEALTVVDVLGSPKCALPQDRVVAKFRTNAGTGVHALDRATMTRLEETVLGLDGLPDVGQLLDVLGDGSRAPR